MKKGKAKHKSYALRIEAHLVEPLQRLKKNNRRSLNAEINAALEKWVASAAKPAAKKAPTVSASKTKSTPTSKKREPVVAAATASDPAANGQSG
jgi:hypothetical protein